MVTEGKDSVFAVNNLQGNSRTIRNQGVLWVGQKKKFNYIFNDTENVLSKEAKLVVFIPTDLNPQKAMTEGK